MPALCAVIDALSCRNGSAQHSDLNWTPEVGLAKDATKTSVSALVRSGARQIVLSESWVERGT